MTVTPVACPRLFEAEAMRDGRLAGAELASFARHAAACSACRREVRALDALGEALRTSSRDAAYTDDLGRLRERTRLVATFAATLVAPRRRRAALRRALWPAATAAMVIAAVVLAGARFRRVDGGGSAGGVLVHASAAAVWTRQSQGNRETVVLDSGELWIQVDHTRQESRLMVALPDGELEDTGTTFTVSAANGRTTRVAVREGRVVLRIRGKSPLALVGGETWARTAEPPLVTTTPRRAPALETFPIAPAASEGMRLSDQKPRRRVRSPADAVPAGGASMRASSPPSALPADAPESGMEFRAAVAVLDVGAHREAASSFARFLARHPRDPRAEDAAYLEVIALQRCGATDDTRRAAQAYLRLFPAGFRRAEIEKLSR